MTHRSAGGGGGGIRTPGTLARTTVFKTVAFVRSATPPVALAAQAACGEYTNESLYKRSADRSDTEAFSRKRPAAGGRSHVSL